MHGYYTWFNVSSPVAASGNQALKVTEDNNIAYNDAPWLVLSSLGKFYGSFWSSQQLESYTSGVKDKLKFLFGTWFIIYSITINKLVFMQVYNWLQCTDESHKCQWEPNQ